MTKYILPLMQPRVWLRVVRRHLRSRLWIVNYQATLMLLWTRRASRSQAVRVCVFPPDLLVSLIHFEVPAWKARFGAECVTYVVEGTLTAKTVKYDYILQLDRRVRNIGIPAYAEAAERIMKQEGLKDKISHLSQNSLNELMRQLMPVNYRGFSTFLVSHNLLELLTLSGM
jgi:hypothetical protein